MTQYLFPGPDWACYLVGAIAGALALGILVWALLRDRSRGRKRCPRCWYDMSGVPPSSPTPSPPAGASAGRAGLKCPECGHEPRTERALLKTHRRWRWVLLAAPLFLYACVVLLVPDARENGWAHRLPTAVLVRLYPWADLSRGVKQINSVDRPVLMELLLRTEGGMSLGARRALAARCLRELGTQNDTLRRRDAYVLIGACGRGVVPAGTLIDLLKKERDPGVHQVAWYTLVAAAGDDIAARDLIGARLREQPNDSAVGIIKRLPDRGEAALWYVPVLVELMKNGTPSAPSEAAWKIMLIGPAAKEALPALEELSRTAALPVERAYFAGAAGVVAGRFASDA